MGGWLRSAQFAETMEPQSRCKFVLPKEVWFLFCVLNRDVFAFVPYYPKGIADSWAQEDRLGEELLEILDAYMKF